AEAKRLTELHHDESSTLLDGFNLNLELYLSGDRQGKLLAVGARDDGDLIGYTTCWVGFHPHSKHIKIAQTDTIYVLPEFRKAQVGLKLMRCMQEALKPHQVAVWRAASKLGFDISALLKRLGFQPDEVSYILRM